jgi:uncharacterized protein
MRGVAYTLPVLALCLSTLSACGGRSDHNQRIVDHGETLLSVSATGRTETRPDMASFSAGVETIRASSKEASAANAEQMKKVTDAVIKEGVAEKDIQTQNISVTRIEYGKNRGSFEAINQISVRVRKLESASTVIGAATAAGANILSGPSMTIADPEKAKLSAYGNAYKAAKARADAYAAAAGMQVSRVLTIKDGGQEEQPQPYDYAVAESAADAPRTASPPINIGTNIDEVSVRVDFALEPK